MDGSSTPHGLTLTLKSHFGSPYLLLGLRLVVGFVFITAGIEKASDPVAFGAAISNYRILPDSLVLIAATILPWMELICGFCVLFGVMVRGGALLITFMLLVFTAALLYVLATGLDISCGCFSRNPAADVIGWWKIAENLGLLCATLLLLYFTTVPTTPPAPTPSTLTRTKVFSGPSGEGK